VIRPVSPIKAIASQASEGIAQAKGLNQGIVRLDTLPTEAMNNY
jgi:hypothetical protein